MSFSDLFDSGFKKRNEDHFASIVRVAMSDGMISESEKTFLDRLARNLDISEANYAIILKDYKTHPVNPPSTYDRRLERLFDLARMVWVDHINHDEKMIILERLCVGLGFKSTNAKYIADKSIELVKQGVDVDDFSEEIKTMNR
ncbi:TerB family tellurite resistance protein [Aurantibacter sp.]|uniref:TerB family tellurite resistance protein n=1 Tax=Aurantibacter sp. TaxID=2807103 RepID=UPI0035C80950